MGQRGRPKTPDILTPREYEVLDLLRAGLSNRDIAERLGISLAGAKFHVSEIISKLGVEGREEAAMWQREPEPSRRWGFAPFVGLREWWAGATSTLGVKGVAVVLVPLVALGVGAGVLLGKGGGDNVEPSPTQTLLNGCKPMTFGPKDVGVPGDCFFLVEEQYTTITEAREFASFEPMMPSYIPDGYEQHLVFGTKRDLTPHEHSPNPVEVHNDWVTVVYRNDEGHHLVISQGFPANTPWGLFELARNSLEDAGGKSGTLSLGERRMYWVDNAPVAFDSKDVGTGYQVSFNVGRFGTSWEKGIDGSYFSGSPMSYAIGSDTLSLVELMKMAESIDLPEMLPPLNGATPPDEYR